MLETFENTDYPNCLPSVSTVIVQKHVLSMNFWIVFHGCKYRPFLDLKTMNEDTLTERYERTMTRIEKINRAGYQVKVNGNANLTPPK